MAGRPKKQKEDIVEVIENATEAVLPVDVEPTGKEVVKEEEPVGFDPNAEEPEEANDVQAEPIGVPKADPKAAEQVKKQADTVTICVNYYQDLTYIVRLPNGSLAKVTLTGNNARERGKDMGVNPKGGAYGMTFGVPAEMWELIKKQHKSDPKIINGLVFASTGNVAFTKAAITERKELRNGNEPLDPKKVIASTTPFK